MCTIVLIASSADRHLAHFLPVTYIRRAAVNVPAQAFVWAPDFESVGGMYQGGE